MPETKAAPLSLLTHRVTLVLLGVTVGLAVLGMTFGGVALAGLGLALGGLMLTVSFAMRSAHDTQQATDEVVGQVQLVLRALEAAGVIQAKHDPTSGKIIGCKYALTAYGMAAPTGTATLTIHAKPDTPSGRRLSSGEVPS